MMMMAVNEMPVAVRRATDVAAACDIARALEASGGTSSLC